MNNIYSKYFNTGEEMVLRHLKVPTGDILVIQGEYGPLELVSLGDYGKDVNLKADFLELDRIPTPVRHTDLLPLEEKWVITISTQYGCNMGCKFCDVPKVGPGRNVSVQDLHKQILAGLATHPEITQSKRLNIHFARMGEPSFNRDVIGYFFNLWHEQFISKFNIHPVVSTMMPKNNTKLKEFICDWVNIKNHDRFLDDAGLQISINSTSEVERRYIFNNNALPLHQISHVMDRIKPKGRKITLNFAVANWEIDPEKLLQYFDPDYYLIKLTPIHQTDTAKDNDIHTKTDSTNYWSYAEHEFKLKKAGYDVIVFIASKEEDEGLITCGNAILSGCLPKCEFEEIK